MQPLAPRSAFALLCCPVCRLDLTPADRSLGCKNGHHFDLARSGYVNLMVGARRAVIRGDRKQQLHRRNAFLATGRFDFIAEAIVGEMDRDLIPMSRPAFNAVDAGCGTGYHLDAIVRQLPRRSNVAWSGLGFDVSKEAAQIASRRGCHLAFAVSDVWSDWPLRSGSADIVVNIFAPKNLGQMARVISPDGALAMAFPGPGHFVELRREFGLKPMRAGKACSYIDAVGRFFGEVWCKRLTQSLDLEGESIMNAMLMAPNAALMSDKSTLSKYDKRSVTIDVHVLFARKPRSDGSSAEPESSGRLGAYSITPSFAGP